jgi:hypothetical protein
VSVCKVCGEPIEVGDFPCVYTPRPHKRGVSGAIGDDIPGGFTQENFGTTPETFYSKKAMAARAKELGLIPFVRWAGQNDRHVKRWDAPDQYTLDAAAALVGRMK